MSELEHVMVELDMLPEDAEALKEMNLELPIVAEFEHHAEPLKVAFGEVKAVTRTHDRD